MNACRRRSGRTRRINDAEAGEEGEAFGAVAAAWPAGEAEASSEADDERDGWENHPTTTKHSSP